MLAVHDLIELLTENFFESFMYIAERMSNYSTWKFVAEYLVNGEIPLTLYASRLSNIKVAIAKTPGPIVRGNISFGIVI